MALTTHDLLALLRHNPQFIGVFPLDRLPHMRGLDMHKTVKMIVNLEPNHLPGSHWVAIYRRAAKGYYFDSFGRLPPTTIRIWLANNTQRWAYQPRMIQSPNDKVSCGYICYEFLKRL